MTTNELAGATSAALAGELRLIVGRLGRGLRQHDQGGLTPSQRSALASIDRHGPIRLSDLADIEGVSAPTLSRIVQRLNDADLVDRRADPSDARAALLTATRTGRDRLTAIRAGRSRVLAHALDDLSPADRAALEASLPALRAVVDALR